LRLADAKPMHLGHVAEADGRWRIYAFAGRQETGQKGSAIWQLCDFLAGDVASPVRRSARKGEDIDALIDVRAIFQQAFTALDHETMPALLRPEKGRYGLRDYEKVFCVDHKSGQDIFAMRGIDREGGCIVVVRPDQYVAHVLPLNAFSDLADFFNGILAVN
jgi:phenol 2-monooxygenase (NADPH)